MLNVPQRTLREQLVREVYYAADLWLLRAKLGRFPAKVGHRRQLFLNLKGGTGKTSLSTSYAYRLAEMGYSVLLMDLDSQGHATKCLGYEGEDFPHTLLDVLVRRVPLQQVIWKTPVPNLDFVPSNLSMAAIDLALMPVTGREVRLANALRRLEDRYDFVLLDAAPSFGLLNLNAILATDDLFVPVLPDFLSLRGLRLLFDALRGVEADFRAAPRQVFVAVNGFNASHRLAGEAVGWLREHYGPYLLPNVIRQCSHLAQATSAGVPIFMYERQSRAAEDIQAMAHDVLLRLLAAKQKAEPLPPPVNDAALAAAQLPSRLVMTRRRDAPSERHS